MSFLDRYEATTKSAPQTLVELPEEPSKYQITVEKIDGTVAKKYDLKLAFNSTKPLIYPFEPDSQLHLAVELRQGASKKYVVINNNKQLKSAADKTRYTEDTEWFVVKIPSRSEFEFSKNLLRNHERNLCEDEPKPFSLGRFDNIPNNIIVQPIDLDKAHKEWGWNFSFNVPEKYPPQKENTFLAYSISGKNKPPEVILAYNGDHLSLARREFSKLKREHSEFIHAMNQDFLDLVRTSENEHTLEDHHNKYLELLAENNQSQFELSYHYLQKITTEGNRAEIYSIHHDFLEEYMTEMANVPQISWFQVQMPKKNQEVTREITEMSEGFFSHFTLSPETSPELKPQKPQVTNLVPLSLPANKPQAINLPNRPTLTTPPLQAPKRTLTPSVVSTTEPKKFQATISKEPYIAKSPEDGLFFNMDDV